MTKIISKILGAKAGKKEYREYMARAKKLPREYREMFGHIKDYIWSVSGSLDGSLPEFYGIIELFEQGVADGKKVIDITGEDVANFCDELTRDGKTWQNKMRDRLNAKVKQL
ncbi:MAG: DUF1048 domain-containing protein [Candidatus Nomurabacteria bacterium]|jgi:DNA-binding ferritin-like protein (Dps family)|nr:DUF1048 domain-containing protein [Candidatus Nomurabacteria bacterium]